ncbi:MAG: phosphoribosylformylglycinamidine synthase subunit PurS, partial [Nitrospinae bacterium]|nr:phosphoribosylformylglycinamidine synthase subunit PurS [Nitrospinota bacterium]
IEMDAPATEQAKKDAEEMCKKLLANPVMENYRVTVAEQGK